MIRVAMLDWRILRPAMKYWWFMLAGCTVGLLGGVPSFAAPMLAMLGWVVAMNLFGLVDQQKLTALFGSLPITRAQVMRGHYLTILAGVAIGWLPWLAATLLHLVVPRAGTGPDVLLGWAAATGAILAAQAVLVPCRLKWGPNKGMVLSLVIFALAIGALSGVVKGLAVPTVLVMGWAPLAVLALGLAALAASLPVSTRIYQRQDH